MIHELVLTQQDNDQWDWTLSVANPNDLNFTPTIVRTGTVTAWDKYAASDAAITAVKKLGYYHGENRHSSYNAYGTEYRSQWDH